MLRSVVLAIVLSLALCEAAPVFSSWTVKSPGNLNSQGVLVNGNVTFYTNTNGTTLAINSTTGATMWTFYGLGNSFRAWNNTSDKIVFVTTNYYGAIWMNNGSLAWQTPRNSMESYLFIVNDMWAYMFADQYVLKVNLMDGSFSQVQGKHTPYTMPLMVPGGIVIQGSYGVYLYNASGAVGWSFSKSMTSVPMIWYNNTILASAYNAGILKIDPATGAFTAIDTPTSSTIAQSWLWTNSTNAYFVYRLGSYRIVTLCLMTWTNVANLDYNSGNSIRGYGFVDGNLILARNDNDVRLIKLDIFTGKWIANTTMGSGNLPTQCFVSGDLITIVAPYHIYVMTASQWSVNRDFYVNVYAYLFSAAQQRIYAGDGYKLFAIDYNSVTTPMFTYKPENSIRSAGFLEYGGAIFFTTASGSEYNLIGIGMMNGSVVYNAVLPHSPAYSAPFMFNGQIVVIRNTDYDSDIGIMHLNPMSPPPTVVPFLQLSGCSYRPSFVVDEVSGNMFGSCSRSALIRVDSEWKMTVSGATSNSVSYQQPPTIGGKIVYATDNLGYVSAFPMAAFTAKPIWTTKTYISDQVSVVFYNDYLYGANTLTLNAYGAKTGSEYWKLERRGSAYFRRSVSPFAGKLAIVDDESNVYILAEGFTAGAKGPTAKMAYDVGRVGSSSSPSGWQVSAIGQLTVTKSDQIAAIDVSTGKWQWNTTESGCSTFTYNKGLLYGKCSNGFTVFSASNGARLLQTDSSFTPSSLLINNGTVYYATSNTVSEFQINAAGVDIPIPSGSPSGNGDSSSKSSSKLWIVGVVAAVIVIAVVVLVIVKVCGSKKDTTDGEYVAMQNPQSSSQV